MKLTKGARKYELHKLFDVDLDTPAFRGRPVTEQRERLLGLREIAAYLNVGRSFLIEHIKSGDLIAYRIGGVWKCLTPGDASLPDA